MLPTSGEITLQMVKDELKLTGDIWLDSPEVRTLSDKPTGQIWLSDLYGKRRTIQVNSKIKEMRIDLYNPCEFTINYNIHNAILKIQNLTGAHNINYGLDGDIYGSIKSGQTIDIKLPQGGYGRKGKITVSREAGLNKIAVTLIGRVYT